MIHKTLMLIASAVLALACGLSQAAPMPAPTCFEAAKKFDSRFVGNWEVAEWQVRYSIRMKGKKVCLYGRDVQGDEWFDISELHWDGKALYASFTMPSTKWRTQSKLTLVDADKLRDDYTNKDGKRTDFWTRRQ